jgi:uncharacterized membrane protein
LLPASVEDVGRKVIVSSGVIRLRMWWDGAFWVIPLIGILLAVVAAQLVDGIDESVAQLWGMSALLSPSSAVTLLAAVGGGMVTFTGFVFSVVLLIIQFGSSSYSPRTVSYFLRSRVTQSVLAIFLATITYAFLALISIGSAGREAYVPVLSVLVCLALLLVSLVAFLVLIQSVAGRIRVDSLVAELGRLAGRALGRNRSFGPSVEGGTEPDAAPAGAVVRHRGRVGQVVGIDVDAAVRLAARTGSLVVFQVRIGDGVVPGTPVALVDGDANAGELDRCVIVHRERSLKYDPGYALRILTDIGLRALSAAINDPTTAVRALDEVEGVLRIAAALPLGAVRIPAGAGSVVVRSSTWPDIVDLAIWEVLEAGRNAPQVTRRLSELLDALLADLPPDRHPPLLHYRDYLRAAVTELVAAPQVGPWLTGDRQGIGGSRRSPHPAGPASPE